jgi:hypothetical protein
MKFRNYSPKKDKKAVHRIWLETGWIDDEKEHKETVDIFIRGGRALVAEINNEAECLSASMPGCIRYLNQDLPFSGITAVATSRIARKQGLAKRLTARLIAADVADGAIVCGLGMFEQGFYNKLGFGTGSYEHWTSFDPVQLKLKKKARVPRRITADDWEMAHAALLVRRRRHGACNIYPPECTRIEFGLMSEAFGLGYADGPAGELTHFIWGEAKGENGPYTVIMMAYQNSDQFLELMALLKNLGDQVHQVWLREPSHVQLQDLLTHPLRYRQLTEQSKYESKIQATAYWQLRICDLPGCLAQTHLLGDAVRFNLKLSDPIEKQLDDNTPWCGVAGDYVVTLGPSSSAERGADPTLPTLTASVGAFTRMWMGVRPASGLAITDDLTGPPDLLADLDRVLCLPEPRLDWDF